MAKIALMIFGPPGSGKGTQANLAAGKLDLIHFDTGRYLREYLHNPLNAKKAEVRHERTLNDTGKLNTPTFVARIIINEVVRISKAGFGIVFSGSPRTLFEANKLIPVLSKHYGKRNLRFVTLNIHPKTSLKRNSQRIACNFCGLTILQTLLPSKKHLKFCPFCGSKFTQRKDDKPEVIAVRLREYDNRTRPIFDFLKKHGYRVSSVNGESLPYKVSAAILRLAGFRTKAND